MSAKSQKEIGNEINILENTNSNIIHFSDINNKKGKSAPMFPPRSLNNPNQFASNLYHNSISNIEVNNSENTSFPPTLMHFALKSKTNTSGNSFDNNNNFDLDDENNISNENFESDILIANENIPFKNSENNNDDINNDINTSNNIINNIMNELEKSSSIKDEKKLENEIDIINSQEKQLSNEGKNKLIDQLKEGLEKDKTSIITIRKILKKKEREYKNKFNYLKKLVDNKNRISHEKKIKGKNNTEDENAEEAKNPGEEKKGEKCESEKERKDGKGETPYNESESKK